MARGWHGVAGTWCAGAVTRALSRWRLTCTMIYVTPAQKRVERTLAAMRSNKGCRGVQKDCCSALCALAGNEHAAGIILAAGGAALIFEAMCEHESDAKMQRTGAAALHRLADCLGGQGKYAEAEALGREVLGALKRVLGAEHPDTLATEGNLAVSLRGQGKYAEAEALGREVLGVRKRVLGAEHPDTLRTESNLARFTRSTEA